MAPALASPVTSEGRKPHTMPVTLTSQFSGSPVRPRQVLYYLLATFGVTSLFAIVSIVFTLQSRIENKKAETRIVAQGYAQRIQEQLQNAFVSTYVLGFVVRQAGGVATNFEETAAELMTVFPSVSALQLAPDGVIRHSFPLTGNEAAIGHDLLADKQRNREAVAAITMRQLTLAGPFDLIQGGVGAVGRLPIFLTGENKESYFWGFANALVRIPRLLESAGLSGLGRAGYHYELWRIHPDTEVRHIFSRNSDQVLDTPVEYVVTIYGGRWILSVSPERGWIGESDVPQILIASVVAVLLLTLLQYLCIRLFLTRMRPALGDAN